MLPKWPIHPRLPGCGILMALRLAKCRSPPSDSMSNIEMRIQICVFNFARKLLWGSAVPPFGYSLNTGVYAPHAQFSSFFFSNVSQKPWNSALPRDIPSASRSGFSKWKWNSFHSPLDDHWWRILHVHDGSVINSYVGTEAANTWPNKEQRIINLTVSIKFPIYMYVSWR